MTVIFCFPGDEQTSLLAHNVRTAALQTNTCESYTLYLQE